MSGPPLWTSGERRLLALVLAALYGVYVCGTFGVVCSNDGSHFAAARALVETRTFRLEDGIVFALNDVAIHEGVRYSSKPPGTAILAAPFYCLSTLPLAWPSQEPAPGERSWHTSLYRLAVDECGYAVGRAQLEIAYRDSRPAQACATLLAPLAGILGLWMTYRTARHLGVQPLGAMATVISLGLGSLYWRYSTAIFAHVISAALLMLQLEWLVSGRAVRGIGWALAWGFLVGAAVAVEYQAAISAAFLLATWVRAARSLSRLEQPASRRVAGTAAGFLIPLAALAWYHHQYFGHPLRTGSHANEHFQYATSTSTIMGGQFWDGMQSMLWSREHQSLIVTSPIVLLCSAGWLLWPRDRRETLALLLALVLAHAAVLFRIVSPEGGGTVDHRYLVRILPILFLPLGFVVDRWVRLVQNAYQRVRGCPETGTGSPMLGVPQSVGPVPGEPLRARSLTVRSLLGIGLGMLMVGIALAIALVALVLFWRSVAQSYAMVAWFMKHRVLLPEPWLPSGTMGERILSLYDAVFPSRTEGRLLGIAAAIYGIGAAGLWTLMSHHERREFNREPTASARSLSGRR